MIENIFLLSVDLEEIDKNKKLDKKDKKLKNKTNELMKETNESLINAYSDKIDGFMAYPGENELFNKPKLLKLIINTQIAILKKKPQIDSFTHDFLHKNSKMVKINGLNLLILPFPEQNILGLMFSDSDNPYDYRNETIKLLKEYLIRNYFKKGFSKKKKSNLLLTLFIDLRKYADESLVFEEIKNKIKFFKKTPFIKLFVFGLDNAGKSSLMRILSTGKFEYDFFPPTKKFRITHIKLESTNSKIVAWDMPGQKIFRENWLRGSQEANLLLFVLDSVDSVRFNEAKQEFWNMMNLYELQRINLLFLVNKIDLLNQFNKNKESFKKQLISNFDLDKLKNRDLNIIFSSLPKRIGISKITNWFDDQSEYLLLINSKP